MLGAIIKRRWTIGYNIERLPSRFWPPYCRWCRKLRTAFITVLTSAYRINCNRLLRKLLCHTDKACTTFHILFQYTKLSTYKVPKMLHITCLCILGYGIISYYCNAGIRLPVRTQAYCRLTYVVPGPWLILRCLCILLRCFESYATCYTGDCIYCTISVSAKLYSRTSNNSPGSRTGQHKSRVP